MNYLSIDNISKAFSDKLLFENISFGIEKGEKTALVAANGTGKSTMMKCLFGKNLMNFQELLLFLEIMNFLNHY